MPRRLGFGGTLLPDGLRARLIVTFGGLTLLAVAAFALLVSGTIERLIVERLADELETQARLLATPVSEDLLAGDLRSVQRILTVFDSDTTARAVVVDSDGRLVAATEPELRSALGRALAQAGLNRALAGQEVRGVLPRSEIDREVLYVALPIVPEDGSGRVVGAVRLSYQLRDIEDTFRRLNIGIGVGALGTAVAAGLLGAGIAGALTTPLRALARATRALADGDFDQQIALDARGEVGQVVAAFNETVARLREFEDARREFAADISHELHALAGAMQTAADALERGADREPALRERLVAGLVGHTRRLGRLADDLLELARLEGGRLALDFGPVSLDDVARQATAEWAAEAHQRGISLAMQVTDDAFVRGDHERLVQACGNLVENALKYTSAGGRVWVRSWCVDGSGHVEVRDNGRGISPEELPFVFHRFYRVEGRSSGGAAGMGLGLAIVDRIVRAHGGTIEVTSQPGAGSSFHIRLPALPADQAPPRRVAAGHARPRVASRHPDALDTATVRPAPSG